MCKSRVSTRTVLVALTYVERLRGKTTVFVEEGLGQHLADLLLSSIIVAHKVCDLVLRLRALFACRTDFVVFVSMSTITQGN